MSITVARWSEVKRQPNAVYIGRGSALGNPFVMRDKSDAERYRVIEEYKEWFYARVSPKGRFDGALISKDFAKIIDSAHAVFRALNDITQKEREYGEVLLGCFCAPQACHGDVIKEYLDERKRGKDEREN